MTFKNIPVDQKLYNEVKKLVKKRVKVWPSAYASGQLVTEYKRQFQKLYGPRKAPYRVTTKTKRSISNVEARAHGELARWFEERWVNVCLPKIDGEYQDCGREEAYLRADDYPYCRPLYRVNKSTPKTVSEFTETELKRMCRGKRQLQPGVDGRPTRIFHEEWLDESS